MAWDTVAPTITAGCYHPSKGRFLHPEQNRSISMREAALLQGFPMSYRFPPNIGKVKIASLIGNALPPPFVAQQARMIRAVVGRRRRALPTMSRGRPL
jgi:DNA (cytosine-5)-methyltransferase 1